MPIARLLRHGLGGVAALQVLGVCLPLLAVGAELVHAPRHGFQPTLERYGGLQLEPVKAQMVQAIAEAAQPQDSPLAEPVAAVWGLAAPEGEAPGADSPGLPFLEELLDRDIRVQLHAPGLGDLRARIPEEVTVTDTREGALGGADFLILLSRRPQHRDAGLPRTAASLGDPKIVFDGVGAWQHRSVALDRVGIFYLPLWDTDQPFFLDERMLAFADRIREQSTEDETILFLPGHLLGELAIRFRPNADFGSTRYFLPLGYQLLPRCVQVLDPIEQSGTVPQYQDWYDRIRGQEWVDFQFEHAVEQADADWLVLYRITPYWFEAEWRLQDLRGRRGEGGR